MRNPNSSLVRLAASVIAAGSLMAVGGCQLGDVFAFARDFNPCGTILNCDPVSYRFLTSGYQGPGVDPDIDPACTYPPFCNITTPGSDPFSP